MCPSFLCLRNLLIGRCDCTAIIDSLDCRVEDLSFRDVSTENSIPPYRLANVVDAERLIVCCHLPDALRLHKQFDRSPQMIGLALNE